MSMTAKVRLQESAPGGGIGSQVLVFEPDYPDGDNREWACEIPHLDLRMTVTESVAKEFELGAVYTLTFTPEGGTT